MRPPLHIVTPAMILFSFGCTSTGRKEKVAEASHAIEKAVAINPLPSWNGATKQAILNYVRTATDSGSADYIPVRDRIATFDNDGTLWAEKPLMQELFASYRVTEMVAKDPSLASKQPFKAVLEHDKEYFEKNGVKALVQLINATHTGITEDEFETSVKNFFETATYPPKNVPIRQIVYQPQIELLNYLRANGFNIFICSGGTIEFVRGISQEFYGVPKDHVIGTSFRYKFIDSNRSIMRQDGLVELNDKEGKPVAIQQHVGQRPVFACGNEGGAGDIAMLKYSQGSKYQSFQMIINHDDSVREYYYQEKDNASLKAAVQNKWQIVSMKNDWKIIFPGNNGEHYSHNVGSDHLVSNKHTKM